MSAPPYDVAVCGAGPVGLTLANLLGVHGVRTLVLERKSTTVDEPRAIAIDAEALRTIQSAGLYGAVAADILLGFHVDYVNGRGKPLFGFQLARTPYAHAQQNSFDQPMLERQLVAGLARFPHVTLRFGHELTEFTPSAGGVAVRGVGPSGVAFQAAARFLVGCDGGRSRVRQGLGIEMRGRTAPQRWLVVDTLDPHLSETMDCRFFCDPRRPAMTLRKQHLRRRWEWMLLPGEQDSDLLDEATIRALLAPHTRVEQVSIERKCIYTFHSIVADRYRDGRVFIAGDAAHMMPPFAGQGMNGGIRDALNLSWKLALVARGIAGDGILDSYQEERRGHVIQATALANRLGGIIQPTSRVLAQVRDAFFWTVNRTAVGRRAFDRFLLGTLRVPRLARGLTVDTGREALVGQYVVQPEVRTPSGETVLLDTVLGPGFALLGYGVDPLQACDRATRAFWDRIGARSIAIFPATSARSGAAVIDTSGELGNWFGSAQGKVAVVRPDRFCAAVFDASSAAEVAGRFAQLLEATRPIAAPTRKS